MALNLRYAKPRNGLVPRVSPRAALAIRERYRCRGVTQTWLAERYGVSVATIRSVIKGYPPYDLSDPVLIRMAENAPTSRERLDAVEELLNRVDRQTEPWERHG